MGQDSLSSRGEVFGGKGQCGYGILHHIFHTLVDGPTVDVLADEFPLDGTVLIVPLAVAGSIQLPTVLSRFITPVVRLARPPVSGRGRGNIFTQRINTF